MLDIAQNNSIKIRSSLITHIIHFHSMSSGVHVHFRFFFTHSEHIPIRNFQTKIYVKHTWIEKLDYLLPAKVEMRWSSSSPKFEGRKLKIIDHKSSTILHLNVWIFLMNGIKEIDSIMETEPNNIQWMWQTKLVKIEGKPTSGGSVFSI